MATNGNQWLSIAVNGCQWLPMAHNNPRIIERSSEIKKFPRIFLLPLAAIGLFLKISEKIFKFPMIIMNHWPPLAAICCRWLPLAANEFSSITQNFIVTSDRCSKMNKCRKRNVRLVLLLFVHGDFVRVSLTLASISAPALRYELEM